MIDSKYRGGQLFLVLLFLQLAGLFIVVSTPTLSSEEGKAAMGKSYYVDATSGKDTNDGLSEDRAWKTLEHVNSATLRPGDFVLFKRGETWRGQLVAKSGDETGYVTYGAYGTGNKPLLLGSITKVKVSDWVHEDGNIWATSQPESDADDSLPVDVGNLIFDHERSVGTKVWNEEDLKKQGDFWYDEDRHILELYSESNPAVTYSHIECALRRHIIDENGKSYVIYENLDLRYGGAHGIGGASTHHIIVRHCDLSYIGGGDQHGGDATVRFGNGIEFWENAHDNLVENCRLWEIYDAALTNQGAHRNSQINIRYQNNVIWNCEYSFEYWNRGKESTTSGIYFENNTCVNAGYGWGHAQRPDQNGRHLMFYRNSAQTSEFYVQNNIFYEATESCLRLENDWTSGLDMDHNCWYQSKGTLIRWLSNKYTMAEFSRYQDRTGQDAHSLTVDPLFADVRNHDFRLAPNSPILSNGIGARH